MNSPTDYYNRDHWLVILTTPGENRPMACFSGPIQEEFGAVSPVVDEYAESLRPLGNVGIYAMFYNLQFRQYDPCFLAGKLWGPSRNHRLVPHRFGIGMTELP